jgi:four helix bundle protein
LSVGRSQVNSIADLIIIKNRSVVPGYKNLDAWKQSMVIVKEVYVMVKSFPKEELYSLTSQTKRAAVSVPANIAEGIGRNYKKDTIQFLHIARGSLYELETLFNIAVVIEMISEEKFISVSPLIDNCLKLINGLIRYYEKSDLK